MIRILRISFAALALAATSGMFGQLPRATSIHIDDNRIVTPAGLYAYDYGSYHWNILIEASKGRFVATVQTSSTANGEQNTFLRFKQIPAKLLNDPTVVQLEGTGLSKEDRIFVKLTIVLKKNNAHTLRIDQGTFGGSLAQYPDFIPVETARGLTINNPVPVGNALLYTVDASGLLNTDQGKVTGLKMGACTLKAKAPGISLSAAGEVTQVASDLSFTPAADPPPVLKIGKLKYPAVLSAQLQTTVVDGS